jgi:hypothetical protein
MTVNVTDSALKALAAAYKVLAVQAYVELVGEAKKIQAERGASKLGQIHVEQALDRLIGEQSHA